MTEEETAAQKLSSMMAWMPGMVPALGCLLIVIAALMFVPGVVSGIEKGLRPAISPAIL